MAARARGTAVSLALFAVSLSGMALVLHLVIWRIRSQSRRISVLLAVLIGVLPAAAACAFLFPPSIAAWFPRTPAEWALVALFHVSVSLSYAVVYSALEEDSPSLGLVTFLAASPEGRSRDELRAFLAARSPFETRLEAAVHTGLLAREPDGRLVLTRKGARVAWVMWLAQRLVGMERGG